MCFYHVVECIIKVLRSIQKVCVFALRKELFEKHEEYSVTKQVSKLAISYPLPILMLLNES